MLVAVWGAARMAAMSHVRIVRLLIARVALTGITARWARFWLSIIVRAGVVVFARTRLRTARFRGLGWVGSLSFRGLLHWRFCWRRDNWRWSSARSIGRTAGTARGRIARGRGRSRLWCFRWRRRGLSSLIGRRWFGLMSQCMSGIDEHRACIFVLSQRGNSLQLTHIRMSLIGMNVRGQDERIVDVWWMIRMNLMRLIVRRSWMRMKVRFIRCCRRVRSWLRRLIIVVALISRLRQIVWRIIMTSIVHDDRSRKSIHQSKRIQRRNQTVDVELKQQSIEPNQSINQLLDWFDWSINEPIQWTKC